MKEQYYKQVWIESEKDLPKENGFYFIKSKDTTGQGTGMIGYIDGIDNLCWINNIDWYLQEVEHPELTDEEISKKLDSINFDTSKEREDAYDMIIWARDRLTK